MAGIKNLSEILRSMNPAHVEGEYVYCTVSNDHLPDIKNPLLIYRESEGTTVILKKEEADALSLNYSGIWGLITLSVHSDLSAVGLLATVTNKLAKAGIAVNVVSAYYHDHLFVPFDKTTETLNLLKKISNRESSQQQWSSTLQGAPTCVKLTQAKACYSKCLKWSQVHKHF